MNKEAIASPFFFYCVFITLFLAIFYNTVTNMAGIYIAFDLGGSTEISVYPMVFFGLGNVLTIPIANPLADRLGSVKLLVICLLFYTFFSILCGLAATFPLFNLFRLGLGLSSGFFYILCRRLIVRFAPDRSLKIYEFYMILFYSAVPVLGACFGAWISYESHWRWIFHINEPISLCLAGYFWFFFKDLDPPKNQETIDWVGYLFFFLGIGALVTAATTSQFLDWYRSSLFLLLLAIGIPSLLFFIPWNLSQPQPLLELKLLRSSKLSLALISLAVLFSSYYGMIILIALWLNIYANYTPLWISVLLGIMGFSGLVAYYIVRKLLRISAHEIALVLSILCFAISCYYSTYFDVEVDFFHLAVARSLAGLGLILFIFPLAAISSVSYGPEQASNVFTLFQLTRSLSSTLGAGLYVILWQRRHIFFHERLGEGLTLSGEKTVSYFKLAEKTFGLTEAQATAQLNVLLDKQATSLALNDVFGCMGYILAGLLAILAAGYYLTYIRAYTMDQKEH